MEKDCTEYVERIYVRNAMQRHSPYRNAFKGRVTPVQFDGYCIKLGALMVMSSGSGCRFRQTS